MVTGEVSMRTTLNTDSEIISTFARPKCPKPPMFPIDESLSLYGTLLEEERPVLCGFSERENACYYYQINEMRWSLKSTTILEERSHASSTNYGTGTWIITGGQIHLNGAPVLLESSELLKDNKFVQGPLLPLPLSGHCTVSLFRSQILLAGGYGEQSHLKTAFILELEEEITWRNLTRMHYGKFGHACGKVEMNFNQTNIITVGGLHQDRLEIYFLQRSEWFSSPAVKCQPIFKVATIQSLTTFAISGGVELEPHCTKTDCRLDSILVYDNNNKQLVKNRQRLSQGRGNHAAVPLPEDVVCSSNVLP